MEHPAETPVHPDYPAELDAYRAASAPVLGALSDVGFTQLVLDEDVVDRRTAGAARGVAVDAVLSTRLGPLPVYVLVIPDRAATRDDLQRLVAGVGSPARRGVPLLVANDLGELTGGRGWPYFVRTFAELAVRPLS